MESREEKRRKHIYQLSFPYRDGFNFNRTKHDPAHQSDRSFKIIVVDGKPTTMMDTAARETLLPSRLMREMIDNEGEDNEDEHEIPFDRCDSNSWVLIKEYLHHLHLHGYTISPTHVTIGWDFKLEKWISEQKLRVSIERYDTLENVFQDHWRVDFFRKFDVKGQTEREKQQIIQGIKEFIQAVNYLDIPVLFFDIKLYLYYRMLGKSKEEVIAFTNVKLENDTRTALLPDPQISLNESLRTANPWIFDDVFDDTLNLKKGQHRFASIHKQEPLLPNEEEEEEDYYT